MNERQVARVLLLNELDQLLLIEGSDPTGARDTTWWFTPGGGSEGTETLHETASRELWEETGLELQITGNHIWERVATFEFMGTNYHQREFFFVARTETFIPKPQQLSEIEKGSIMGFKWWSRHELESTNETIFPTELKTNFSEVISESSVPRTLMPQELEFPETKLMND